VQCVGQIVEAFQANKTKARQQAKIENKFPKPTQEELVGHISPPSRRVDDQTITQLFRDASRNSGVLDFLNDDIQEITIDDNVGGHRVVELNFCSTQLFEKLYTTGDELANEVGAYIGSFTRNCDSIFPHNNNDRSLWIS
jgi:hypothetical protein